jgi:metallo-beta-lactamase family protein
VGYQAPGTLGRRLVDGAREVRVRGHTVPVNARIHTIGAFSAHAGRRELLEWVAAAQPSLKRVFLCHGEPPALDAFARTLRAELGVEVVTPSLGQSFPL